VACSIALSERVRGAEGSSFLFVSPAAGSHEVAVELNVEAERTVAATVSNEHPNRGELLNTPRYNFERF
jgi:hypothetical protein